VATDQVELKVEAKTDVGAMAKAEAVTDRVQVKAEAEHVEAMAKVEVAEAITKKVTFLKNANSNAIKCRPKLRRFFIRKKSGLPPNKSWPTPTRPFKEARRATKTKPRSPMVISAQLPNSSETMKTNLKPRKKSSMSDALKIRTPKNGPRSGTTSRIS